MSPTLDGLLVAGGLGLESPVPPPDQKKNKQKIWRCLKGYGSVDVCIGALQVLCPCAKRKERRDEMEPLDDESLEDSDNTLGLSAQDLRDPAAIVSLRSQLGLA